MDEKLKVVYEYFSWGSVFGRVDDGFQYLGKRWEVPTPPGSIIIEPSDGMVYSKSQLDYYGSSPHVLAKDLPTIDLKGKGVFIVFHFRGLPGGLPTVTLDAKMEDFFRRLKQLSSLSCDSFNAAFEPYERDFVCFHAGGFDIPVFVKVFKSSGICVGHIPYIGLSERLDALRFFHQLQDRKSARAGAGAKVRAKSKVRAGAGAGAEPKRQRGDSSRKGGLTEETMEKVASKIPPQRSRAPYAHEYAEVIGSLGNIQLYES